MVERKVDDTVRFLGKNVTFARDIAISIGIDNRVKNYTNDYTDNWSLTYGEDSFGAANARIV